MAAKQFKGEIRNGPSKFDIMVALFDGKEVFFTLVEDGEATILPTRTRVYSVQAEDGSHESWNLAATIKVNGIERAMDAYYDSRRRVGRFSAEWKE